MPLSRRADSSRDAPESAVPLWEHTATHAGTSRYRPTDLDDFWPTGDGRNMDMPGRRGGDGEAFSTYFPALFPRRISDSGEAGREITYERDVRAINVPLHHHPSYSYKIVESLPASPSLQSENRIDMPPLQELRGTRPLLNLPPCSAPAARLSIKFPRR